MCVRLAFYWLCSGQEAHLELLQSIAGSTTPLELRGPRQDGPALPYDEGPLQVAGRIKRPGE